ncbi:uncharacterized protein LOC108667504 [Hyalella azteca]|uniref:Uncharacterized protein LOC108667504 n=1 Tax=Hyalella azteca TaxID=294128 RepID=A0A8B7N8R4_HYAAZ|nr:uncharacterized protein LOC108667504 [Hyalella azteca]
MLSAAGQAVDDLTASSVAAISSKLQQVRGYITQTTAAMTALEQQADLDKIGQYNTLVKVLRELKTSESKLSAHLATLQTSGASCGTQAPGLPNSQSIGQVSVRTVDAVDDSGGQTPAFPAPAGASFSDRLTAGMQEASLLNARLRANVERREDLVERYRATRERLSALKRQRRDIQQQERSILLAQSSRESPYEDPIPGAASWSLEEINAGLADFRGLYEKVDTLRNAYDVKTQALDAGDAAGQAELASKLLQLATKRAQLIAVISQLKRHRADKMREHGMDVDGDEDDFLPLPSTSSTATTTTTTTTTVPPTTVSTTLPTDLVASTTTTTTWMEPRLVF